MASLYEFISFTFLPLMNIYFLIPFVAFFFNGFVWTFIYAQKKQNPINRAFLFYAAVLALWLITVIILRLPISEEWILPLMKIGSIGWLSVTLLFLNFTYVFIGRKKGVFFYTILTASAAAVIISLSTGLVVEGYKIEYWGYDETPGILFLPLILLVIVIPAFYSLYLIWKKYKETEDINLKHSLPLLLFGSLITLVIGLLSNVVIPHLLNNHSFFQFAESGTVIQSLFIFRAVTKYRLFTIGVEEAARDLFDKMEDAVLILNNKGDIEQINKKAKYLFNGYQNNFSGKHISRLFDEYDFYTDSQNIERVISIQGESKILSISQSSIVHDGMELGKLVIVRDITEKKVYEEKLKKSYEELKELSASLQSAREEERAHIAREIHDELGQVLTAMRMDITLLAEEVKENENISSSKIIIELDSVDCMINNLIQTVRDISSELRPGVLDHLGLISAIEWQAREFNKRTGVECNVAASISELNIEPEKATAIFRIYQEALTNIIRHAMCTKVNVYLGREDCDLLLQIKDNGRGITEEEKSNVKSIGIIGMRERSWILGGKVKVEGKPGEGTLVTLRVPLAEKNFETEKIIAERVEA